MGLDRTENPSDSIASPLRILVVDDDELNRRMMHVLLTRDQHQVHVASNGMDALVMVKSQEFDIILMDLQMPVMDGVDASRQIREWENGGRHTYIVALTASYLPEKGQELFEAGIDNYLSKPFEMNHLRQMLRHGLDYRKAKMPSESILGTNDTTYTHQSLDHQKGLKQVGGDDETYRDLLSEFIQGLPEKLKRIRQCLMESDFAGLSRAAHNLKGVSSTLGALQLSEYARRLEIQADGGYTKSLESLIIEIEDISGNLIRNANIFLAGMTLKAR